MINCCWIDPTGEIFPVDFHKHGKFALQILKENIHPEQAIEKLARRGWLHVGLSPFVSFKAYNTLKDGQIKALFVVLDNCTSSLIEENITSYIHA